MLALRVVVAAVALAVTGGACQKASDATQAKRMPQPPPPPSTSHDVDVPDGLRIEVVAGGKPAAPIDAARLRAVKPDFADSERRAWKLQTLLGSEVVPPGTNLVVSGAPSAGLVLTQPQAASEPQPVLMLNRRGDVIATMLAPNVPFPPFHGEGGRLRRPGDTTPHLGGVTRIVVTRTLEAK
jgi:hypothetical protein